MWRTQPENPPTPAKTRCTAASYALTLSAARRPGTVSIAGRAAWHAWCHDVHGTQILFPAGNDFPVSRCAVSPTGPFLWVPPEGQELIAHSTRVVAIMDTHGVQSGSNFWKGLTDKVDEWFSHDYWSKVPWATHSCDVCTKDVHVNGQTQSVRAAVTDGLTACRSYKCSIYGCVTDLPRREARCDA